MTEYSYTLTYFVIPSLLNVCPDSFQIQVYESVSVKGSGFDNSLNSLRCILNGVHISPISYWDSTTVTCVLNYPNISDVGLTVDLNIVNDCVFSILSFQTSLSIKLKGACESSKSVSSPNPDANVGGCICPPGIYWKFLRN